MSDDRVQASLDDLERLLATLVDAPDPAAAAESILQSMELAG